MRVERVAQHVGRGLPGEVQVAALAERVNAGIGAACAVHPDLLAAEALDRAL